MSRDRAIFVIQNEKKCVLRNIRGCDRECDKCDLNIPSDDILMAYDMAIEALDDGDDKR